MHEVNNYPAPPEIGNRISSAEKNFGVTFHDYKRAGQTGILLSSGCGIGMALMDECPNLNYFVDIDNYRFKNIDWECLLVSLTAACPSVVVLAGWHSLDRPVAFERASLGVQTGLTKLIRYIGGESDLRETIQAIKNAGEKHPR